LLFHFLNAARSAQALLWIKHKKLSNKILCIFWEVLGKLIVKFGNLLEYEIFVWCSEWCSAGNELVQNAAKRPEICCLWRRQGFDSGFGIF
jgi:hypothetical protein